MSGPEFTRAAADLRRMLDAAACSVAVVAPDRETLRYVAADGEGAAEIVGVELPVGRGLAGWVATSGQAIAVREARADARFAADVAERTGYVPDAVLVAPFLAADGEVRGVLTLLDPGLDPGDPLPLRDVEEAAARLSRPDLPAWSLSFDAATLATVPALPIGDVRDWAFGAGTGAGVRVAVLDSGIDADHPRVGGVAGAVAFEPDDEAPLGFRRVEGPHEDLVGHGTACAGIIRSLAPDAEIYSVRVLGSNLKGRGALLRAGIAWALEHDMAVANLSLSSRSAAMFGPLHESADAAYFAGTVLVSAANNAPGPTYPSQYASVVSVAAREGDDPWSVATNPRPPVEFGARGIDVDVAWADGGSIVATGNSFAAPHVTGLAALVLGQHPGLSVYQVKSVLQALSQNAAVNVGK
ncbi:MULTISPECIES: S8 family serine peptidase [unclassified Nocardioides]|uniref:S8 family serine peptidase n=1 Tax=unclassified Nocardioides TaxID=2615069 RepID=UPI0009EFE6BA|nr:MULTISPECIES: S8 family serine peptidase [unclassified Nocardioides]GAW49953.1 Subtilisin [Nocardioides sp. PD653-B2]GAW55954.1 Subtilisin [Nocardioides sp. PD653]